MALRKISEEELQRKLEKERRDRRAEQRKAALVGPDGKPLNSRKVRGKSKAMMEEAIVAKLFEDGVIAKVGDQYHFDTRKESIEGRYSGDATGSDIRAILYKIVVGFHVSGTTVSINGHLWEAQANGPEADRDSGREDRPDGGVLSALQRGVCAEGWSGHPADALGGDGRGGSSGSPEFGQSPQDNARSEGVEGE